MRLFPALFRKRRIPGNLHTGKHRLIKPVSKDDFCKLKTEFEIEERNMFFLRHPYLTVEQSCGHVKALGKQNLFMQNIILKKKDFYENVSIEARLGHLRYKESWD